MCYKLTIYVVYVDDYNRKLLNMLLILLPSYYICCCLCCKVTTKCLPMHLVPVIQLEIEIARTRRHQLLRRQSHSPECMLSKTLSNFNNRHEVVEIFNKMCRQKCIWFQSSKLKSKSRGHVATNFWGDSRIRLNAYFPRHFQTSTTDMRSLRYSTKCVGKNASGSSHPTWIRNRENTSQPTSEETVAFAWMHAFQDTFNLQQQTWGRWDIQQNV